MLIVPTGVTGCDEDEFLCGTGHCIASTWRCDGDVDCTDLSDELNCANNMTSYTPCSKQHEFSCSNGGCVHFSRYCDGQVDCEDGSDERNCKQSVIIVYLSEIHNM